MNETVETRVLGTSEAEIADAGQRLARGELVAFPTETVYGLGADATNDLAVARIFAAKKRPSFNPLIAHVPDLKAAETLCDFNEDARRLAAAFWPGALTLVLPLKPDAPISKLVTAGGANLAVRVPSSPIATALLRAANTPVAAPSANPSGQISPTTAAHVLSGLGGRIEAVIDAGRCAVGLESTIIGFHDAPILLRAGGIPAEKIEDCIGTQLHTHRTTDAPTAPGQLASHYAPAGNVRLNVVDPEADEFHIGFGDVNGTINLSTSEDLQEAAANLFKALHIADATGRSIAVAPVPETGLGRAINDR
ncbi:MAG: threonylcarbamoyl-AMP synthase, partial [Boseongicola sp.]|nr:threonylcarbamoyl-AMP synthase [Boseongicola sp.]